MHSARLSLKHVAMLLLIAAACGNNGGPTDSDADQPPVKVIFLTTPAGATVYFDGDSVGVTCPEDVGGLAVEEVPWGMHTYRLVLEGYKTVSKDLNIIRSGVVRVEVELEVLLSLEVITTPQGATVRLNGEAVIDEHFELRHTPFTIEGLTAGEYEVSVTCPGYFTETRTVPLTEQQPHVTAEFELYAIPVVSGLSFFVADQYYNVVEDTEPFPQARFRFDWEWPEYFVHGKLTFAEALPLRMAFRVDVLLATTLIPTPRLWASGQRSISEGATEADIGVTDLFLEQDEWWTDPGVTGYYMEPGTYTVKLWHQGEVLIEGQFEIR